MTVFNAEELQVFSYLRRAASSRLRKNGVSDPLTKALIDGVKLIDRVEGVLQMVERLEKGNSADAAASRGLEYLRQQIDIIKENDAAHARAIAPRGQPYLG